MYKSYKKLKNNVKKPMCLLSAKHKFYNRVIAYNTDGITTDILFYRIGGSQIGDE